MKTALLLIDLQNDYYPGGKFPLWNTEVTTQNIQTAIAKAQAQEMLVVHIQHIADPAAGIAPFFNEGTEGAAIVSAIHDAAPDAPVIVKHYADSFYETELEALLQAHGIEQLLICGMMTQNCVTHTAISKAAEKYQVAILPECTTTINEAIHLIGLHAVSTRMPLLTMEQAFGA